MNTEVLVHIKASSKASDDQKYTSIARNVLHFRSGFMTKVSDGSVSQETSCEPSGIRLSTVAGSQICTPIHMKEGIPGITSSEDIRADQHSSRSASSLANSIRRTFTVSKTSASSNKRNVSRCAINPPFRSPLRSKPYSQASSDHIRAGIACDNLVVPTRGCTEILVPNTGVQNRKRKWSGIRCSDGVFVANSWPSSEIDDMAERRGSEPASCPIASPAVSTGSKQELATMASLQTSRKQLDRADVAPILLATNASAIDESKRAQSLNALSVYDGLPPSQTLTHNGLQVTQETMNNKRPTLTDTVSSTATPSTQYRMVHCSGSDKQELGLVTSSPINLVTPEPSACDQPATAHDLHKFQMPDNPGMSDSIAQMVSAKPDALKPEFSSIQTLPLVINAPEPTFDQLLAPTYLNPILLATAEGLALPARFRPESLVRRIGSKERGFWKVPVVIAEPAEALRLRQGTMGHMASHQRDSTWRPLLKHRCLTEEEFLNIWDELNAFVAVGSAGWTIKVIRRNFSIGQSQDLSGVSAQFYLQIYCYGEAIPYVYAMLLVCTRMYVLCMPLQWISALDDCPIVTMTGHETRKGSLGKWTKIRDDRGVECWGFQ